MPSSLTDTPEHVVESTGSGTRHAFLRPMPGVQPAASGDSSAPHDSPEAAKTTGGREVLARLFSEDVSADSEQPEVSVAGLRLGHFVIEERIGRGGMGAVFRAVDERLRRVVALKILAPAHSRDPGAVERFKNEAQAAARLDHENIARVHYVGEDQGVQFIAFEFIRGTNVRDFILQKGMLAPVDAVNYAMQIAQALRHTQAAGVVHRDIKPSNIIITPAGRAKLVDLGLARQEQTDRSHDLTVDGTTLGTFDYIAPEQAVDPRKVDVRADIYSLGCTLYHMLTGEPPFPAGTMFQKVVDHHRDAPPDPADRNGQVSPQLSRIVRRMMASNPDERYAGPDNLIQDFTQVAQTLGLRPTHADDVVWITPLYESRPLFWEQNRGWLLTLAALLLIALGVQRVPWEALTRTDNLAPAPAANSESDDPGASSVAAGAAADADDSVAPAAPVPPVRSDAVGLADGASGRSEWPSTIVTKNGIGAAVALREGPDRSTARDADGATDDRRPPSIADFDLQQQMESFTTPLPGRRPATVDPVKARAEAPFVVIDPESGEEEAYATLEAACQEAPDGAHIELRWDGVLPRPQPPVRIQDKRLVIRAQEGKRPVMEFQAGSVPGRYDVTRMISIEGGALRMYDVTLVVPVQTALTDRWSVFSLAEAEEFEMRGVEVTIRNPQGLSAAVVEFVPPRNLDPERFMPDSMMNRLTVVDWEDCVVRGECDIFVHETLDPVDVRLENIAFAARGTFAKVFGREALEQPVTEEERLSFRLRHVTAVMTEGILNVDTDLIREFIPIEFFCEDSAIVVRSARPLISMSVHQDVRVLQQRLMWQSTSSYYDVTGHAWGIDRLSAGDRLEYSFEELGISDDGVLADGLLEHLPNWSREVFSSWTEREFELRSSPSVPNATDGRPVGVLWTERVPKSGLKSAARPRNDAEDGD